MDNRSLGKFVLAYRESCGLTQDDFAEACNLTKASISRIERGYRPSIQSMMALSDVLKVSFEGLVSRHQGDLPYEGPRRGSAHPKSKLDVDQVRQVRERWVPNMSLREMSRWIREQFGVEVSESWVSLVVRNLRHVSP